MQTTVYGSYVDCGIEFTLDPKVFMSPMIRTCNGDLQYTTLWGRSTVDLRTSAEIISTAFPFEESSTTGTPNVDIQTTDPTGSYRETLYKVTVMPNSK